MGSTVSDSSMKGLRHVALVLIGLRFGDCQRFFNIPGASQVKPGGSTRVTPTNNNVLNIRPSSGILLDAIDAAIATSFKTAAAGDDEERVTNRRVLIDQFATPAKQRDEAAATEEESDVEDGGPESVLRQLRKIRKTKSQPSQPTAERNFFLHVQMLHFPTLFHLLHNVICTTLVILEHHQGMNVMMD